MASRPLLERVFLGWGVGGLALGGCPLSASGHEADVPPSHGLFIFLANEGSNEKTAACNACAAGQPEWQRDEGGLFDAVLVAVTSVFCRVSGRL